MTRFAVGDEMPAHNPSCMVCGPDSASRMYLSHARVVDERGSIEAGVVIGRSYQGAPHHAHGGAVAAVLDDAMGYAAFVHEPSFVTAHMETDFRRPVLLDTPYVVSATAVRTEGRKIFVEARLLDGDDVLAEAEALFLTVPLEHFRP